MRPARLERATSWFVVVIRKIDHQRQRTMKIRRLPELPVITSTRSSCLGRLYFSYAYTAMQPCLAGRLKVTLHMSVSAVAFGTATGTNT